MKVVIAEKPSVAFDIARALGRPERREGYLISGGYFITWAIGHLFEIDDSIVPSKWSLEELPVFPSEFKYSLIKGKEGQFKVIKKLLEKAELVVNCGDAGREGELIIREILEGAKYRGKVLRLWTSEALTREVVKREFSRLKPSHLFDDLYYSALARQHGDWIVGINLTRLVSLKAGNGEVWSVGRVQTPTLSFIVKRDLEVESFKPETYFTVKARFNNGSEEFEGVLAKNGEELRLDEIKANEVLKSLKDSKRGLVKKVERERKVEQPPLLHSLTSLQREANSLYGFSAQKTLDIAQSLYEGWKVISYPRTDARYMAEDNEALVEDVLRKLNREDLISRVKGNRIFNSSKLTDHHAIIPLDRPPNKLRREERLIYDLILRKFLGSFMDDYVYEVIRVEVEVNNFEFLSKGRRELNLGWMSLYERGEKPLPELIEGEEVEVGGVRKIKRKTKPPPRYTDSTILKEMERLSLGTPSTRANIIETLIERGYVLRRGRTLISTYKGRELIDKLKESKVSSPEMTSEWEKNLEGIYLERKGVSGYHEFIEKIKEFVREEIGKISKLDFQVKKMATPDMVKLAKELSRETGKSFEGWDYESVKRFIDESLKEVRIPCKCGGEAVHFNNAWKCNNCNTIIWWEILGKRLSINQISKLFQGKEVKVRGLRSRRGKSFSATLYLSGGKIKFKFS